MESCGFPVTQTSTSRHTKAFSAPPPQVTFLEKILTGFAKVLNPGESTEMSSVFHALWECQRKNRSPTTTWFSHPSPIAPFPRIGIDLRGISQNLLWKQMDNSLHGFPTRYAITKAPTAEIDK
ncbi:hypothetical protein TNIN_421261 [Trichonephila inaurata madagascariensis]|uniref:Uncharacterized protein n=1 Tax=Trichonephila inaurata madagascariensis TaxID=2747483 RepID=A0A8X7CPR9_9ARAC|nr:hypothetical protein TNIN_421261 [Trichonephila inaurata madagascariensis]